MREHILHLTPREIVKELTRYIVGQDDAKKAVAIALRNRWRRKNLNDFLSGEVVPKNILMIGQTGVGKTETARRIAKISGSPFVKVEATKFTEVGYVGRNVESIIHDLVDVAVSETRQRMRKEVEKEAEDLAMERVIDALVGENASVETRNKFAKKVKSGKIDDKEIEIEVSDNGSSPMNSFDIPGMPGMQMGMLSIGDIIGKTMGERTKTKRVKVSEALKILIQEESDNLIDDEKIIQNALSDAENYGIVFIDEIDKTCARQTVRGSEVSREGVQRDLLPIIEGTSVPTKYGRPVRTDHMLFIVAGAFHTASPSDLLPELQGRLPIRVELKPLSKQDLVRILKEPEGSLIKQYIALLATESVEIEFTEDGIEEIAKIAHEANKNIENIGARRLHTIMEKLLEEVSFEADSMCGQKVVIDVNYVNKHLEDIAKTSDLSKFIL